MGEHLYCPSQGGKKRVKMDLKSIHAVIHREVEARSKVQGQSELHREIFQKEREGEGEKKD